jgi:hypothetical protein
LKTAAELLSDGNAKREVAYAVKVTKKSKDFVIVSGNNPISETKP